MNNLLKGHT